MTSKTQIIYTRITKPNEDYLRGITAYSNLSRAQYLDGIISYVRKKVLHQEILKHIAKARNKVSKKGRKIPKFTS